MKLLITGGAGMLGKDLVPAAAGSGHDLVALTRAELDITDADAVLAAVDAACPDVILNCAAWTDVDGAEAHSEAALAVNGLAAGHVARAASECGAWIVHISSDYVFSGHTSEPYVESDRTAPLSAYGRSKLAGELAVAEASPERHTIVRSSWLFGNGGTCFPATILRLAQERAELTVVDDQIGCPTFTGDLSDGLVRLCDQPLTGIVHMAGAGACSWFDLASAIVERSGLPCTVRRGRTEDLARPAPRPAYSVLGSERIVPRLPHWRDGLRKYMAQRTEMAGAR